MSFTRKISTAEKQKYMNLLTPSKKSELNTYLKNLEMKGVNVKFFQRRPNGPLGPLKVVGKNVNKTRKLTIRVKNEKLEQMIAANIQKKATVYRGKKIAKPCKWHCQGETCWAEGKSCPFIHKGNKGWNAAVKKTTAKKV